MNRYLVSYNFTQRFTIFSYFIKLFGWGLLGHKHEGLKNHKIHIEIIEYTFTCLNSNPIGTEAK